MNKNDILLVIIICSVALFSLLMFNIFKNDNPKTAIIYYENKEILKINLTDDETNEYIVKGYNGDVKINTLNGKIKVVAENSPLHLCSKQGYISSSYETIVCLPNKIIIKIIDDDSLDSVIG